MTALNVALVLCLAVALFAPAGRAIFSFSEPVRWTGKRLNAVSWTQRAGRRSGGRA
jgi:hypothetical protein